MSISRFSQLGMLAMLIASGPIGAQVATRATPPGMMTQQGMQQQPVVLPTAPPIDTAKLLSRVTGCWNLTMGTYHPAIPIGAGPVAWSELPMKIQIDTVRSSEKPDSAWRMKAAPSVSDTHPYDYFTLVSKDSVELVFGGPKGVKVRALVHLDNMDGIAETYTPVRLDPASHAIVLLLRSSCR